MRSQLVNDSLARLVGKMVQLGLLGGLLQRKRAS
jgi:hypothetical protein